VAAFHFISFHFINLMSFHQSDIRQKKQQQHYNNLLKRTQSVAAQSRWMILLSGSNETLLLTRVEQRLARWASDGKCCSGSYPGLVSYHLFYLPSNQQ
jgi:hypothetical protein